MQQCAKFFAKTNFLQSFIFKQDLWTPQSHFQCGFQGLHVFSINLFQKNWKFIAVWASTTTAPAAATATILLRPQGGVWFEQKMFLSDKKIHLKKSTFWQKEQNGLLNWLNYFWFWDYCFVFCTNLLKLYLSRNYTHQFG